MTLSLLALPLLLLPAAQDDGPPRRRAIGALHAFLTEADASPERFVREHVAASLAERVPAADLAARLEALRADTRGHELEPARLAAWTVLCSLILNLDEVVTQS